MEILEVENIATCLCVVLIVAALDQLRRDNLRGREWVKRWIGRRGNHGAYHALMQELSAEDSSSYTNFVRMYRPSFDELLELVTPLIKKKDTNMRNSISPAERLALTLRYLATGESFVSLQYLYRIHKSTVAEIIPETCEAIYNVLKDKYLQVPDSQEEWLKVSRHFEDRWNFPNCIGAIDGKHVAIKCPPNSGSVYYNYKNFFSIILLAVVDADYNFLYVDVGSSGRSNDSGVYAKSKLCEFLEHNILSVPPSSPLPGRQDSVPYVIVGDDAFPLKNYILKPYPNRNLDFEKRVFNYRLSRARRISENVFGILATRFGIFQRPICLSPPKASKVVLAACGLHNFLRSKTSTKRIYTPNGSFDGDETTGEWRHNQRPPAFSNFVQQGGNRNTTDARDIRDEFCDYFNTNGQVEWQWELS